jgi:hypothetical protein
MQMMDAQCVACGKLREDFLVRGDGVIAPCDACGGKLERIIKHGVANAVRPDEIPGGVWMKHAICNPDGTPKRYDRWSDVRKAAKEAGYENHVEHLTDPKSGSDKAKWTTRWVGVPQSLTPEDEAERIRAWHEHEAKLQQELQHAESTGPTSYDSGAALLGHLEN